MSREHLYRAKRANWRELPKEEWWVEGFYVKHGSRHWIYTGEIQYMYYPVCADLPTKYEVEEETVCEYTGLDDKNGRKIFEGDFISCKQYIGGNWVEYCIERGYVEMKHGAFGLHRKQRYYRPFKDWMEDYEYEIIGNIFDNLELFSIETSKR